MKFLNWLFSKVPPFIVIIFVVSLLAGVCSWLFGARNPLFIGIVSVMMLGALSIFFVWGRQLYWWITSSGDYEKDKKQN